MTGLTPWARFRLISKYDFSEDGLGFTDVARVLIVRPSKYLILLSRTLHDYLDITRLFQTGHCRGHSQKVTEDIDLSR